MEQIYVNKGIIILFVIFIIIFILLALYLNVITPFIRERAYIKMEIKSSGTEEEYYYWKRELKRMYLRKIPIFGRFYID